MNSLMNKYYNDYFQFAKQLTNDNNYHVKIDNRMDDNLISLTPYIYNACSANCQFCSEKLVRGGSITVCNGICSDYADKLSIILNRIRNTPIFLSLSGKEPTESPEQLRIILDVVNQFQLNGGQITEKVIYSNLSGFAKNYDYLINILNAQGISRIECSRHHFNEDINQDIVLFKTNNKTLEPIKYNTVFTDIVRRINTLIPIRMVCVLQKSGISKVNQIQDYLQFADSLGVTDVVFRELAMFGNSVELGNTQKYIVNNRVELMDIISALPTDSFHIQNIIKGYYYFSFCYTYNNKMKVSFEMSDYEEMIKYHSKINDDKIYKLVFYPNGLLCKDWNMKSKLNWF